MSHLQPDLDGLRRLAMVLPPLILSACGGGTNGPPAVLPPDASMPEQPAEDAATSPPPDATRMATEGPPPVTEGLLAYFPLDDASGAANAPAAEVVGGIGASYVGTATGPTRSEPGPLGFTNPGGAHFAPSESQGIRVANAPAALKPTESLSLSFWVRTTAPGNMDMVSMGDNYGARTGASVDMFTRGGGTWHICPGTMPIKDGLWHHAAAVKDGASVRVYVDGKLASQPCDGVPPLQYDQGADLWIGQHGNGGTMYPFDGDLDDVRIYGRALTPEEIGRLAGGA